MANKNQADTSKSSDASATMTGDSTVSKSGDPTAANRHSSSPNGSRAVSDNANAAQLQTDGTANADGTENLTPVKQRVKTIDSSEADIGWTSQQGARPVAPEEAPVVYTKEQLATVEGLKKQGIDPQDYLSNYNVDDAGDGVKAEEAAVAKSEEKAAKSAEQWDEVQNEVKAGPEVEGTVKTNDPRTDKSADGGPGDPRTHTEQR